MKSRRTLAGARKRASRAKPPRDPTAPRVDWMSLRELRSLEYRVRRGFIPPPLERMKQQWMAIHYAHEQKLQADIPLLAAEIPASRLNEAVGQARARLSRILNDPTLRRRR